MVMAGGAAAIVRCDNVKMDPTAALVARISATRASVSTGSVVIILVTVCVRPAMYRDSKAFVLAISTVTTLIANAMTQEVA